MSAFEANEHREHAEHAHDPFTAKVSITIAVLAVMAATTSSLENMESGAAITSSSEAVLAQDKATDAWSFYQAKSVKKNIYDIAAAQGGPKAAAYEQTAARNGAEEAAIQAEAKNDEKDRDRLLSLSRKHERRHHWLTAAATMLEIGIAICTVAIITRRRAFWLSSIGLGLAGMALFGASFAL